MRFFSIRTPLNFFAAVFFLAGFFTAMNSPDALLRLVHVLAPPSVVFSCERFFTAPLRVIADRFIDCHWVASLCSGTKALAIKRFQQERIRTPRLESRSVVWSCFDA